MKRLLLSFLLLVISFITIVGFSFNTNSGDEVVYKNKNATIGERVEDLLKRMTLEEKIEMIGGTGFETKAIKRLDIPPLNMSDGPLGVRWDNSTALPSGILLGATWNPEIVTELGKVLGTETKAKGRHVILAPCVNIARIPMGGRNFESFGEDPFLTSRIAVNYIKGVQQENVVATVKHFAANNQEYQRDFVNTIVDERTLNEIYFPAFKAAVEEANVLAVMCAYNKINNHYCSENDYLLIDVLKNKWKFDGLVMSDWGAVHSTIPVFNGGLDLEMPTGYYLNTKTLFDKIKSGELSESKLDDKVRRILRVMFTIGLFDEYKFDSTKVNTEEHKQTVLKIAKEGIVLLKNENSILPLNLNKIKSIAVIGPNSKVAVTGGGGSSMVIPFNSVSPLEALQNKIGDRIKINFSQGMIIDGETNVIETNFLFTDRSEKINGLNAEYFDNINLEGKPAKVIIDKQINFKWNDQGPFKDFPKDNFSVRWTGYIKADKSANYTFDVTSDDGVRLFIDDQLVIKDWTDHGMLTNSFTTGLKQGQLYKITLEYYEKGGDANVKLGWRKPNDELIAEAINTAKQSDVAIIFAGTNSNYESEGFDRKDLILPNEQDSFIKRVTEVNKNTIVVLTTGSPVLMDAWLDNVSGLLEAWFAGEQAGNAIAEVLLGETNPSGKLPVTFPKKWEDCSAFNSYKKLDSTTVYEDGIYVGYRHFEKKNITPLFPFGFGLSYTTFKYSNLKLSSNEITHDDILKVTLNVMNTGKVNGSEVIQLYVKDLQSSIDRPEKELKGFKKVSLEPGQEKTVEMTIDKKALSFFDPKINEWVAEKGEFEIMVGSSSQDIKLTEKFILK